MKGRKLPWSADELHWIESHKNMARPKGLALFVATFNRPDVTLGAYANLCKRKGWLTGRDGRFAKGQQPANKGKQQSVYMSSASIARTRATRFKQGQLPHNTKHEGHERLSKDGYVEVSVREVNPHTGFERRYVQQHRWLWELENGPVPDGMCLKSVDGTKTNTAPSNWKLIPRSMLPRLNNRWGRDYDHAPAEVKPALMAIAEIETKVACRLKSGKST